MTDVNEREPGPLHPDFEYPPLTDPLNQFRLLECSTEESYSGHLTLRTYPLQRMRREYVAISYVWGKTTDLMQIVVNNQPFAVTSTAEVALRQVTQHKLARYIWLDAICIDQANDEERGHQVRNMGCIYSFAKGTAASTGMNRSFQELKKDLDNAPYDLPGMNDKNKRRAGEYKRREIVMHLEQLAYFSRMWIL